MGNLIALYVCHQPVETPRLLFSEPYILDLKMQPTYTADLKDAVGLHPIL